MEQGNGIFLTVTTIIGFFSLKSATLDYVTNLLAIINALVIWNVKQVCVSSQALRSFKVTMSVDPKFHPKIIGRKGAVISQIRKDHDVSIQFPDKGDEQQVLTTLTEKSR